MRQAYFSVWFPLILRLQKKKEFNWKYVRAKCYQTRDSHSPRTYHCLQLGALMQLLIEILCCQPAPLPPSPAICPLSNSDSRLTFSRGRKREGPGMRLKLPPFCQEHHIQLEFPQKKDRDSSPSFTILLRRGKGRQLQWYFLWSVILLKCLFSWAANLQERAIKLCQNNFREESCGVPSDV